MKLYVIDQISISSVQGDSLRPGNSFEVSDTFGNELLTKNPHALSKDPPKGKAEPAPKNKMAPAPKNKAN